MRGDSTSEWNWCWEKDCILEFFLFPHLWECKALHKACGTYAKKHLILIKGYLTYLAFSKYPITLFLVQCSMRHFWQAFPLVFEVQLCSPIIFFLVNRRVKLSFPLQSLKKDRERRKRCAIIHRYIQSLSSSLHVYFVYPRLSKALTSWSVNRKNAHKS